MIKVITNNPVALDSPDHLAPHGTRQDNSRNPFFNEKLFGLFPDRYINVLDLGCSGGGFVKDMLDVGHFAVGLEGSDWSKKAKRAEWATIPDYLFTCDITKPFRIERERERERESRDDKPVLFDVITAWEVLEHIAKEDLNEVLKNIVLNMAPGGMFVMSTTPIAEVKHGLALHQTIENKEWWIKKCNAAGLYYRDPLYQYFNGHFLHNGKNTIQLVCTRKDEEIQIPKTGLRHKLFDCWAESRPQKLLQRIVTGRDSS